MAISIEEFAPFLGTTTKKKPAKHGSENMYVKRFYSTLPENPAESNLEN